MTKELSDIRTDLLTHFILRKSIEEELDEVQIERQLKKWGLSTAEVFGNDIIQSFGKINQQAAAQKAIERYFEQMFMRYRLFKDDLSSLDIRKADDVAAFHQYLYEMAFHFWDLLQSRAAPTASETKYSLANYYWAVDGKEALQSEEVGPHSIRRFLRNAVAIAKKSEVRSLENVLLMGYEIPDATLQPDAGFPNTLKRFYHQ